MLFCSVVFSQIGQLKKIGKPEQLGSASLGISYGFYVSGSCKMTIDALTSCVSQSSGTHSQKCLSCTSQNDAMKSSCSAEIRDNAVTDILCDEQDSNHCYDEIVNGTNAYKPFNCTNKCQKKYASFLKEQYLFKSLSSVYGWNTTDVEACVGVSCVGRSVDYYNCLTDYSSSKTFETNCNRCSDKVPPCSCLAGPFSFDGNVQSDVQYKQNILSSSSHFSQNVCLKIDCKSCGKEFFNGNYFNLPIFDCNNNCHRNYYKNVVADPFQWPGANYTSCPLNETLSGCKNGTLNPTITTSFCLPEIETTKVSSSSSVAAQSIVTTTMLPLWY